MTLLFVANFGRDVGYAWHTIIAAYRAAGQRLAGVRTLFAFPDGAPGPDGVAFDYAAVRRSPRALLAFLALLRRERVGVLYLTDLETWSWRYPLCRLAGVRTIVVHDRTSGARVSRLPGALKRALHRSPLGADLYIGISRYVVDRLVAVNGVPAERAHLVYNGIDVARFGQAAPHALQDLLGLPHTTRIVFASGRAQPYKGIAVLIEAAARLEAQGVREVAFVYCGDGPALADLRRHAQHLAVRSFHFLGRRDDVPRLLGSATVAAVPALWEEAFGLTVIEAMAAGVPVVASRVGAVPELVREGETGLLVPPGDAAALAAALEGLLADEPRRRQLATAAQGDARTRFSLARVADDLAAALRGAAALPPRS